MGAMATPFDPADLPTGILMTLSPLVARVLAPNPSPFTYTGTQTYLVGGADVAVIDPGPDEAEHLDALVAAIGGRRVVAILCTHTHRDHSPAARPLSVMTGAPVITLSGRAAGLWSRWVWVHRIATTRRPPIAATSASRCSASSGPGSITATSAPPTR